MLKKQKNKLNHATVRLSEFQEYTYRVAHDLSAPIRAMVELSKTLKQDSAPELSSDTQDYLSLIIESGQKIQAMIDGLLQYSRLDTMVEENTPVNLDQLVQQLLLMMSEPIKKSGATLLIQHLPIVHANTEKMTCLFQALIENSLKFQSNDHAPHITISAEKKDDMWQFAISDNGIGIQQQFHDKIFRLFGRLHLDNEYSGVGIGLTLAQKIVRGYEGDIWFESTLHHGCTFYFTLPVCMVN